MTWLDPKAVPPPVYTELIIALSYIDAEFDMENGGYDNSKEFLTEPIFCLGHCTQDIYGNFHWNYDGVVVYYMHIPPLPKENQ